MWALLLPIPQVYLKTRTKSFIRISDSLVFSENMFGKGKAQTLLKWVSGAWRGGPPEETDRGLQRQMPPTHPLSPFFTFYHSFDPKVLVELLCAEPLTGAFIQVPSCLPLCMEKPARTTCRPGYFQAPVRGQAKGQRAERGQE